LALTNGTLLSSQGTDAHQFQVFKLSIGACSSIYTQVNLGTSMRL